MRSVSKRGRNALSHDVTGTDQSPAERRHCFCRSDMENMLLMTPGSQFSMIDVRQLDIRSISAPRKSKVNYVLQHKHL